MDHHWSSDFTWWTAIGIILYGLCLWRVLTARDAWFSAMASMALTLYTMMPSMVYFTHDLDDWPIMLAFAVPGAIIATVPMSVYWRRQDRFRREKEAAVAQARADEAEKLLRKFGA